MAIIRFNLDDIKPLVEHALASKKHRLTFGMMFDPKYHHDDVVLPEGAMPRDAHIDPTKVKPFLLLAKDDGVYLVSSGLPLLPGKDTASQCAYAHGMGPGSHATESSSLGNSDFTEAIDIGPIAKAIALGAKRMHIHWQEDNFEIVFDPPKPSFSRAERVAAEEASGGATDKPKWASPGMAYKGAIFGFDTNVVFQKVGRGLIVHERDLLDWQPGKGQAVTITYPPMNEARATVVDGIAAAPARKRAIGPDQ